MSRLLVDANNRLHSELSDDLEKKTSAQVGGWQSS